MNVRTKFGLSALCCAAATMLAVVSAAPAHAQCGPTYFDGGGLAGGVDNVVYAMDRAPNGDLIVGGQFSSAAGNPASRVARWDGWGWSSLGGAIFSNSVSQVAVLPNGDVVVAGAFLQIDGVPFSRIARWDGTSWHQLGQGVAYSQQANLFQQVNAMVVYQGKILIGGILTYVQQADGTDLSVTNLAMYDPATDTWSAPWSTNPTTSSGSTEVDALLVMPNGDLLVGGLFSTINGVGVSRVARWNGSTWLDLHGPAGSGTVFSLAVTAAGEILAGLPGSQGVRRYAVDGSCWCAMPFTGTTPNSISRIGVLADGTVIAVSKSTLPSVPKFWVWNGSTWVVPGAGLNNNANALNVLGSSAILGGQFTSANSNIAWPRLVGWTTECLGACCGPTTACAVTTQSLCRGVYRGDNTTCDAPCTQATGVCCRGMTCNSTVSAANCTASGTAGALFVGTASACNAGSNTTPCCHADFNKSGALSVQDIFDFLAAWFGGSPFAKSGGDGNPAPLAVQDIFDFLSDWFTGC